MGGNPIGPYGDIKGNYTNAIKSNLDAIKYTLQLAGIVKMISESSYKTIKRLNGREDYDKVIELEDMIYKEFSKRVRQLGEEDKSQYFEREDDQGYDR